MDCPVCDGFIFRPGPRGGMSQNVECVGCKTRFNVTWWCGELVSAEPIPADIEWREDLFPQVLQ